MGLFDGNKAKKTHTAASSGPDAADALYSQRHRPWQRFPDEPSITDTRWVGQATVGV